jgi:hypothetical protein
MSNTPQGGTIEDNAADGALMGDQGVHFALRLGYMALYKLKNTKGGPFSI